MYQQCTDAQLIDSNSWKYLRRLSKHKKWIVL